MKNQPQQEIIRIMSEQMTDAAEHGFILSMKQAFFAAMLECVIQGKGDVFRAMVKETHQRRFSDKAEWPDICNMLGMVAGFAMALNRPASYLRLISDKIRVFGGTPEALGIDCE